MNNRLIELLRQLPKSSERDYWIKELDTNIYFAWSIQDIKSIRPHFTDDQCLDVLSRAESKHDPSIGINWDILEVYCDEVG